MSNNVAIAKGLRELMKQTLQMLSDDPDALDADDAVQTDDGYGGRAEPGAELFRFTYTAKKKKERWDIIVTADQIAQIAVGKLKKLNVLAERPAWEAEIPTGVYVETEEEAIAKHKALEDLLRRAGGANAMAALLAGQEIDEVDEEPPPPPPDANVKTMAEAIELLKLLTELGALELTGDADHDSLAKAMVPIIESEARSFDRAQRLSDTLLAHPGVEELHASDDDLGKVLSKW
jgi:hypothetical protein